jgi:hypothetical protein
MRIVLICNLIALICNPVQVRGEVLVDKSPAEMRYALIRHLQKRGYELDTLTTSAVYITHGATYQGVAQVCQSQKMKFTLQEQGDKTLVKGFGFCYTNARDYVEFPSTQMDTIIVNAVKEIPLRFP